MVSQHRRKAHWDASPSPGTSRTTHSSNLNRLRGVLTLLRPRSLVNRFFSVAEPKSTLPRFFLGFVSNKNEIKKVLLNDIKIFLLNELLKN